MSISTTRGGYFRRTSISCGVAVLFASAAVAHSSRPMFFERFDRDSGLSQLSVTAIAQDATGFLWVGTEDGLDKYDGYRFTRGGEDAESAATSLNDYVAAIVLDPSGALWVVAENGDLTRQAPATGKLVHVSKTASVGGIRTARFSRDGHLWLATRDAGVIRYDPRTGTVVSFPRTTTSDPDAKSARALLEDHAGRLWLGSDAGLHHLDTASRIFHAQPLPFSHPVSVSALIEDRAGHVWIGTDSGLVRLDASAGTSRVYAHEAGNPRSLPSNAVNTLFQDSDSRIWVGTSHGLALLNTDDDTFDVYAHDDAERGSLPDDNVQSLFQDRSGELWVGTKFGGLSKWSPHTWRMGHQQARSGFGSRKVMAFTEDRDGRLWVATFEGGISIVDRVADVRRRLGRAEGSGKGLSDERVMALLTDRNGYVWAGTMQGGLNRIDPATLAVKVYAHDPANPTTLGAPGVMSLFEDSKGQIWVGTYGGGLSKLDPDTGVFQHFAADPKDVTRLASDRVTAIGEDALGSLWVGTDGGGLHLLNAQTGSFTRFRHDAADAGSLSSDTIYALHTDAHGRVWVGTRAGGLDKISGNARQPAAIRFVHLTQREGLPNDTVYGVHSDASGALWVSTNYGLARVKPDSGEVRAFHRADGLQDEEFNFGAHYASSRGELFFGGNSGYNAFFPEGLDRGRPAPKVVLTSVALPGGKTIRGANAHKLQDLHIGYRQNDVTFEFAALDFEAPRDTRFQYLLEGSGRGWTDAGTRRTISFSDLPGGNYTLRIRAGTHDGIWSRGGPAIALNVDPPPWRTNGAYTAYFALLLLAALGAWLMMRRRWKRVVEERERLESLVKERTRELQLHASALEVANRHLEEASSTDAMTGLGNRRSLELAIPRMIASLPKGSRLALVMADMDRLKPINDEFGHEAGDRVIMGVGSLLRNSLRHGDKLSRWGGDEFVLAHVCRDADEAAALVERMRVVISKHRYALANGAVGRTSCSFGFAMYPFVADAPDLVSWRDVLRLADGALYRAKKQRNACVGWDAGVNGAASDPTARILAAPEQAEAAGLVQIVGSTSTAGETIELMLCNAGGVRA